MELSPVENKKTGRRPRELLLLVLLNALPVLIIALLVSDLMAAIETPSSYPFGDSINSPASIYVSQTRYILFHVVQIVFLHIFISISFMRQRFRRLFYILVIINFLLFLYPMLTGRD